MVGSKWCFLAAPFERLGRAGCRWAAVFFATFLRAAPALGAVFFLVTFFLEGFFPELLAADTFFFAAFFLAGFFFAAFFFVTFLLAAFFLAAFFFVTFLFATFFFVTFFFVTAFFLGVFFLAEAFLVTFRRVTDLLAARFRAFDVAFFRDDFFLVTILQSSERFKNNRRIIHTLAAV